MEEKNKPRKFRKGNIVINEWTNKKDDREFITYSIQKIYKNADGEWASTSVFNKADISSIRDAVSEYFSLVKPLRLEE